MPSPEHVSFPSSPSEGLPLDGILAKFANPEFSNSKRETWAQHTLNALSVFDRVRKDYEPRLQMGETFWRHLRIAVLFHDAGKFILNFQRENRKKEEGGRPNWNVYLRHEMISTVLMASGWRKLLNDDPYPLFAVAAHHKPFRKQMFQTEPDRKVEYRDEDLDAIVDYLKRYLIDNRLADGWKLNGSTRRLLESSRTDTYDMIAQNWWGDELEELVYAEERKHRGNHHPRRRYFANMLGMLHVCDWYASGYTLSPPALQYTVDDLTKSIREKFDRSRSLAEIAAAPFDWRKFQRDSITERSVLAIAPTGSGKTEASLLWAARRPAGGKVIYCLPTQVTSNAIFDRLKEVFPDEAEAIVVNGQAKKARRVAVVHGSARFFRELRKKDAARDDEEDDWNSRDYLQDKTFFRDFTVCTVDQLLTTGFNLRHWELKSLHLNDASIVIDEIHMFEPYTLGLIVQTIRYLTEHYNARFYIMTATMPKALQQRLQQALGDPLVLREKSFDHKARNLWQLSEGGNIIDGELEAQVLADLKANRKVLIVRNTVDSCIETFEHYARHSELSAIPAKNRVCLHSRFTRADRQEKERVVVDEVKKLKNEPFLLVATQVVEVSLDIDFDVLYTELAPIDALSQRAGRVNRKRDENKATRVVVFPHGKVAEHVYGSVRPTIFAETWAALKRYDNKRIEELQLLELIEELFQDFAGPEDQSYREGLSKYEEMYPKRHTIYENPHSEELYTREGLDANAVMPLTLWNLYKHEKPAVRSLYQLSLRKNQLRNFECYELPPEEQKGVFFKIVDDTKTPYNNETGLPIPEKKNTNPTTKCL